LIQQLKQTQRAYLLSLGIGFDQPAYFEERLRIGMAHAWVGVPISLYQCAYRALSQLILDVLPAGDEPQRQALTAFVLKITTLDMTLAIETYHASQLSHLEDEVARVHYRADQLHRKAVTDALTGLLNHENVFLSLEAAISEAQHSHQPLSVLMADLDYFKRVNDSYGHLVGDGVLQEVAARILASLRAPDRVGRYGGEEFLIILANTDTKTALQVAERIRARIAASPINTHGQQVSITISVGVTTLRAEDDFHAVLKRADEALYHAKGEGRDRVVER
jgi:diguanylate cyclase (GGDEF)-like protein